MRSGYTFLCLLLLTCASAHAQYIYTFAGNGHGAATGSGYFAGDGGLAKSAEFNAITGVAFDGAGNIYIADKGNNRVRKISTAGIVSTLAGTGVAGYSGDNGPATAAKLNQPYSVAADVDGNVYISDFGNHVIRKVNTFGVITNYAGTHVAGYSGDGGPASVAKLNNPTGIAVDSLGNLYIADAANNVVRQVNAAGSIGTIAGTGTAGFSGDGGNGSLAMLHYPVAVAVDPYQQVYIADYFNNRIRKVDAMGTITTYAGDGTIGHSGDGGAAVNAKLNHPSGVAVFSFDKVYIADQGNNLVRVVNISDNIISTIAGIYTNGYAGDGGPSTAALISSPKGLAADGLNRLFISDYDNNVIRVVTPTPTATTVPAHAGAMVVYPNPAHNSFSVAIPATTQDGVLTISDVMGRVLETRTVTAATQHSVQISSVPAGHYFIKFVSGDGTWNSKVEVR